MHDQPAATVSGWPPKLSRAWLIASLVASLSFPARASAASEADDAPETVAGRTLSQYAAELQSENRPRRLRAVRSLGAFGRAAGPALVLALDASDPAIRYLAAIDLGRLSLTKLPGAERRLEELSASPGEPPAVAMAASFALAMGAAAAGTADPSRDSLPRHLDPLVAAVQSPQPALALSAAELLGMLGPAAASAVPALEAVAKQTESKPAGVYHVDRAARHALQKMDPQWTAADRDSEVGPLTPRALDARTPSTADAAARAEAEPAVAGPPPDTAATPPRPNILWISCEDLSPNLGCYGDGEAITPNLDRLASQGMRWTRAFTPAAVCAVVRSSLITGRPAPQIGSQHMRTRIAPPDDVRCFPEFFRIQGYFCTNRSKTDYQFDPPLTTWDRNGQGHQDWRERPTPETPFFAVINLTMTHESQIRQSTQARAAVEAALGTARLTDPQRAAASIPPYFPSSENALRNWAWYRDNITLMDLEVGRILDRLAADGLEDSTIVVFWSDHGMGLPRGKRWLYDTGTQIPMILRWPGRIPPGSINEQLTSLLDLPPTMMALAGIPIPPQLAGRVLLGEQTQTEPDYLFFFRDRMDEAYDLQRGARDRRWKYIRNYQSEKPYLQPLEYMDQMPVMQDLRQLAADARQLQVKLSAAQAPFLAPHKPIEELYDTDRDRWEIVNLADEPQYASRLARMRQATEQWQEQIGDLGMIPEPLMMAEMFLPAAIPPPAPAPSPPPGERSSVVTAALPLPIPQTEPPRILRRGDVVTLICPTNGATIAFRRRLSEEWSPWKIYTSAIELEAGEDLEAIAVRIGYRDSPICHLERPADKLLKGDCGGGGN